MAFQFSDLSILIVDDDPSIREITAAVLRKLELGRIDTASSGEEAFELFKKHNHSLIITDWQMEPIDGLELIRMIRRQDNGSPNAQVPVILSSGYCSDDAIEEIRASGVNELLVKPYSADDLIKRVVYVLNRPRKFIKIENYFGPDRRRRTSGEYEGPERRQGEESDG